MKYPINWKDDNSIRQVFSYQTLIGIAPKFGSRPIAWYQAHQCHAHDIIVEMARKVGIEGEFNIKCRNGIIYIGKNMISASNVYDRADNRSRQ